MTLTKATSSTENFVLFDDYVSGTALQPDQQETLRPVNLQIEEAYATINRLHGTIEHLKLELDQANSRLREKSSSVDKFAAESIRLQSQVEELKEERDKTKIMFHKIKRAAKYVMDDSRQSERECVELRLEVEALKRERDEYKKMVHDPANDQNDDSGASKEENESLSGSTYCSYHLPISTNQIDDAKEANRGKARRVSLCSGKSLITAETLESSCFGYECEASSLNGDDCSMCRSCRLRYKTKSRGSSSDLCSVLSISMNSVGGVIDATEGKTVTKIVTTMGDVPTPLSEVALIQSTSRSA